MLKEINNAQPKSEQLEESVIEEYVKNLPEDNIEEEEDSESIIVPTDDDLPF